MSGNTSPNPLYQNEHTPIDAAQPVSFDQMYMSAAQSTQPSSRYAPQMSQSYPYVQEGAPLQPLPNYVPLQGSPVYPNQIGVGLPQTQAEIEQDNRKSKIWAIVSLCLSIPSIIAVLVIGSFSIVHGTGTLMELGLPMLASLICSIIAMSKRKQPSFDLARLSLLVVLGGGLVVGMVYVVAIFNYVMLYAHIDLFHHDVTDPTLWEALFRTYQG